MIDIKPIEKKLLTEPCWIDLGGEIQIRVDYPTRGQETELRRLKTVWEFKRATENTDHWIDYYLRITIKEVRGLRIEIEPNKYEEARLDLERGLAGNLLAGNIKVNIIEAFVQLDILEIVYSKILEHLSFSELDKKKFQSQPNLSGGVDIKTPESDLRREQKSLTDGTPSSPMEQKTSLLQTT